MRSGVVLGLLLSLAAASATARPLCCRTTAPVVADFDPTSLGLHDYAPPTPIGGGFGNAYFGGGYMEYLFSGGRTPHLPPHRVYAGPVHTEPYSNRRLQLRAGMTPRGGVYVGIPEGVALVPIIPVGLWAAPAAAPW